MNVIDIIIIVCLAISFAWGLKDGAIRQAGALAAIIIALILAKSFGPQVATLLNISGEYAHIWGYAIVVIVCFIGVGAISTLLRKIVSVAGLGSLDRLLGGVISLIKCALLLSLIFSLFNILNSSYSIVDKSNIDGSKLYRPIISTSSYILPAIHWAGDQLPKDE
ncbi:MAG: CvpA family protein [Rikenellaceae bacterium]